jgi:C-terminal processing protease CtpA/Prc
VDLRGNGGGNMWPMLQGLSPILGVGIPGYFVPPEGPWEPWMINRAPVGPLALTPPFRAVAVLHDSVTASSGEAVAVAFRGRQQARSFGQSTRGLSTANRSIPLGDGAVMALTVSIFADRRQNTYGGPIPPDEPIPLGTPDEEVLGWASEWLSGQPSCASR